MRDKLKLFLKKNGFLTLLFLCVCFVAGTTLYLATRDLGTGSNSGDTEILEGKKHENLDIVNLSDQDLKKDMFNDSQEVAALDEPEEEEIKEEIEEEIEEETEDGELEFIESEPRAATSIEGMSYPVEGEIITEFVDDGLVYSETLEEWRAHVGIDIKAELNTTVKAPLGGVIKSVYEDELWGKVIVIDHGNGLESKLANLGTTEMVREGLEISKGDHIATVGKTPKIEMLMEDHLHFEVIKDGKNIDPRSIIH